MKACVCESAEVNRVCTTALTHYDMFISPALLSVLYFPQTQLRRAKSIEQERGRPTELFSALNSPWHCFFFKEHQLGKKRYKTKLQYCQTNIAGNAKKQKEPCLPPRPPVKIACRKQSSLLQKHPGGVTFPSPETHWACPVASAEFRDNTNSLHGSLARRVTSN